MAANAGGDAAAVFVYGSLMHPAVCEAIIGRVPPSTPATVPGYARRRVAGEAYPACVPTAGGGVGVEGLVLSGCTAQERAVFDLFEELEAEPPLYTVAQVTAVAAGPAQHLFPAGAALLPCPCCWRP